MHRPYRDFNQKWVLNLKLNKVKIIRENGRYLKGTNYGKGKL